jgi:hypothetical protein
MPAQIPPIISKQASEKEEILHWKKQDSQITSADEGMRIDLKPLSENASPNRSLPWITVAPQRNTVNPAFSNAKSPLSHSLCFASHARSSRWSYRNGISHIWPDLPIRVHDRNFSIGKFVVEDDRP